MTIIYFILMLGIIIFIHELGHMLVAKAFNVYVSEFALGFGPKILSRQGKETTYSLRAIPLGGFTGMVESEETPLEFDEEGNPTRILTVEKSRTFYGVAPWKRILILLAGPVFNIILACLVYVMVFQITGYINEYPKPYIEAVMPGSAAEEAGLQAGDLITSITYASGKTIYPETFADITIENQGNTEKMTLEVLRGEQKLTISLTPRYDETSKAYLIGITAGPMVPRKISFLEAIPTGISYALQTVALTFDAIVGLFTGAQGLDSLGGTISIYKYTEEAASYGLPTLMSLAGSLSVSVGLMNLIPIPVFDGGKILLTIIEMIIGHRVNERFEIIITYIGLALILILFVFVTYQDIMKLL